MNPSRSPAPNPDDACARAPDEGTTRSVSIWHRPVSYYAQCWVAWVGLTAFGVRGLVAMSAGAAPDVERLVAVALSLVWGIDLLRGRSRER